MRRLLSTKKGTYFNCEISGQKALGGLIHENNRPITYKHSNKDDVAGCMKEDTTTQLGHSTLNTIPIPRPLRDL